MGLGEQVHYSFLGRIWTAFCFVPVALIPQVIQEDHLQVHNHHGCTRIAKDSSGDLGDAHLQVQIHHDDHGGCFWLWDLVDLCTSEASLW